MKDNEIIEGVLKEFAGLAKCPRPSRHEKIVSDYIVKRLGELGITQVVQDDVYNVIADVPATQGCEDLALTIVQGHMDMVCVAKPGVDYDPLTSEIKLVREGNILRADGTSLGADDGIAVAVAVPDSAARRATRPAAPHLHSRRRNGHDRRDALRPEICAGRQIRPQLRL